MANVDAAIAADVAGWGGLSVAKAEAAIDWWVDRFDPARCGAPSTVRGGATLT